MDCSPSGSSVHEIFQARILEWVAISLSRGFSQPRDQTQVSCTAGRFFTDWATRAAHISIYICPNPQNINHRENPNVSGLWTLGGDVSVGSLILTCTTVVQEVNSWGKLCEGRRYTRTFCLLNFAMNLKLLLKKKKEDKLHSLDVSRNYGQSSRGGAQ